MKAVKGERPPPVPTNICAVFVTFQPDQGFQERLRRIAAQVSRVIIVDNGSSTTARNFLQSLSREGEVDVIALDDNYGIAAALNRGLERALQLGYSWALTFDQDSLVDPELVPTLIGLYREYPHRDELAVLGANYRESMTGRIGLSKRHEQRRDRSAPQAWFDVDEVITSGCLQSLAVFQEVGGYREELFIQDVDNEFCKRVRLAGYRIILTAELLIAHRMGNSSSHRMPFGEVVTLNYPPWRYYYVVRNGILTAKDYFFKDALWSLRRLHGTLKRSVASLALEREKVEKAKHMLRGARDGVLGRTGRRH